MEEIEKTDDELIEEYLAGNQEAFSVIIKRHTPSVYGFVRKHMRTSTDAEDVTQETFIKAWKKIDTYRIGENFKTWLFSVARNTAIDMLRKRRQTVFSDIETEEISLSEIVPDSEPLADELFAKGQDTEFLNRCLEKLTPEARDILLLHYTNDFTFDQIGKILGKPLNTVKSIHRRALLNLRKIIEAPKTDSRS